MARKRAVDAADLRQKVAELESEIKGLCDTVEALQDAEADAEEAEGRAEEAQAEVRVLNDLLGRLEAERARVVELWQEARRVGADGWARAELDRLLEPNPALREEA